MATIPRKYIDNYTKALNKLSKDAQERLAADLSKINFDADASVVRDAIIDRMEYYCGPYSDMAAVLAAEFYDGLRKREIGSALGALAESGRKPIATEKAVRGIMQDIVDGKPPEVAVSKLVSRVDYEIKKSAGECIYRNGKRDPRKPRFARVPSGSETCSFCIMLASRGFVYQSKETAGENGHYHANCDCRIVPGFDGETTVPGYDPDLLYAQWRDPEKHKESKAPAKAPTSSSKSATSVEGIKPSRIMRGVHQKTGGMTSSEWAEYKRELDAVKYMDEVWLPDDEYAMVMSELNTHMNDEDRKHALVRKAIGDNVYTVINRGFNKYTVIDVEPID